MKRIASKLRFRFRIGLLTALMAVSAGPSYSADLNLFDFTGIDRGIIDAATTGDSTFVLGIQPANSQPLLKVIDSAGTIVHTLDLGADTGHAIDASPHNSGALLHVAVTNGGQHIVKRYIYDASTRQATFDNQQSIELQDFPQGATGMVMVDIAYSPSNTQLIIGGQVTINGDGQNFIGRIDSGFTQFVPLKIWGLKNNAELRTSRNASLSYQTNGTLDCEPGDITHDVRITGEASDSRTNYAVTPGSNDSITLPGTNSNSPQPLTSTLRYEITSNLVGYRANPSCRLPGDESSLSGQGGIVVTWGLPIQGTKSLPLLSNTNDRLVSLTVDPVSGHLFVSAQWPGATWSVNDQGSFSGSNSVTSTRDDVLEWSFNNAIGEVTYSNRTIAMNNNNTGINTGRTLPLGARTGYILRFQTSGISGGYTHTHYFQTSGNASTISEYNELIARRGTLYAAGRWKGVTTQARWQLVKIC